MNQTEMSSFSSSAFISMLLLHQASIPCVEKKTREETKMSIFLCRAFINKCKYLYVFVYIQQYLNFEIYLKI